MTTGNAHTRIESLDDRATQIQELSTGRDRDHTFGLVHHFVYSHPGIIPANYNNTGRPAGRAHDGDFQHRTL